MNGKRSELANCTEAVKYILMNDQESRSNYGRLFSKVDELMNPTTVTMKHAYVLEHRHELGLPQYESISRARRLLQANHPELRASQAVRKVLFENEEIFREYSKDKKV